MQVSADEINEYGIIFDLRNRWIIRELFVVSILVGK